MAFLLPNLSPSLLQPMSKDNKPSHPNQPFSPSQVTKPFSLSSSSFRSFSSVSVSPAFSSVQTPTVQGVKVDTLRDEQDNQQRDDFFVNLGLTVRTLGENVPLLFTKDLNYDIYRDFKWVSLSLSSYWTSMVLPVEFFFFGLWVSVFFCH